MNEVYTLRERLHQWFGEYNMQYNKYRNIDQIIMSNTIEILTKFKEFLDKIKIKEKIIGI